MAEVSPEQSLSLLGLTSHAHLRMAFQPIIDLKHGCTFAFEALTRCSDFKSPPELFELALANGCIGELGRYTRQCAVQHCAGHPLFLNVHPAEFDEKWIVRLDDPIFEHSHDVFLEITESVPLGHFQRVWTMLKEIRNHGIFVAVDDLGAGYSNLTYLADLAPEIVKLDRELIVGLADNPRRRTVVTNLVRLCEELGAKVVAEGIETPDELHTVIDAGVRYAQGYIFARPTHDPVDLGREQIATLIAPSSRTSSIRRKPMTRSSFPRRRPTIKTRSSS